MCLASRGKSYVADSPPRCRLIVEAGRDRRLGPEGWSARTGGRRPSRCSTYRDRAPAEVRTLRRRPREHAGGRATGRAGLAEQTGRVDDVWRGRRDTPFESAVGGSLEASRGDRSSSTRQAGQPGTGTHCRHPDYRRRLGRQFIGDSPDGWLTKINEFDPGAYT